MTAFLRDALAQFSLVATIEEHSLIGGFGAAVSEWLIDNQVQPGVSCASARPTPSSRNPANRNTPASSSV